MLKKIKFSCRMCHGGCGVMITNLMELKAVNPKVVALSPHDSSAETINLFQDCFKDSYRHIVVGKELEI